MGVQSQEWRMCVQVLSNAEQSKRETWDNIAKTRTRVPLESSRAERAWESTAAVEISSAQKAKVHWVTAVKLPAKEQHRLDQVLQQNYQQRQDFYCLILQQQQIWATMEFENWVYKISPVDLQLADITFYLLYLLQVLRPPRTKRLCFNGFCCFDGWFVGRMKQKLTNRFHETWL